MALDRDLGVAIVRAAVPDRRELRGAELFAATGVRGLRLLVETERFARFVLLERGADAVAALRTNVAPYADRGARAVRAEARRPPLRETFDYLDLDPFGTPEPFVDAAIAQLPIGGILATTATDLPVLAGVARGVAERRYGGRPVRGRLGPEGGLRLLLARLATGAGRAGRAIVPIAAYVQDHHLRAIVRIGPESSPPSPVGLLDPATTLGPRLPSGPPYGPMWLGPLFDPAIIERLEPPPEAARPRSVTQWIDRFRGEARIASPF